MLARITALYVKVIATEYRMQRRLIVLIVIASAVQQLELWLKAAMNLIWIAFFRAFCVIIILAVVSLES